MTDSESADDTKSWPAPFALPSEETRDPVTTSGRRRLSEGRDDEVEDPRAWDRLAVGGRRLGRPPRRPKTGSSSGSAGPDATAGQPDGAVPEPPSPGDDLARPWIQSGAAQTPAAAPLAPPPAVPALPLAASPRPVPTIMPARQGRPNRRADPAPASERTDAVAPDGPQADGPATAVPSVVVPSAVVLSEVVPSGAVPAGVVSPEARPSDDASGALAAGAGLSDAQLDSGDMPTGAVPSVSGTFTTTPSARSQRRPLRPPPDLAALEEMRVGGEGRAPDWMARRIVESEAPGAPYELGRPRRWRRRKVTVLRSRTNRRLVRRIDTWTVFKVSLLFYLLMLIIVLVAGVATWSVAQHLGFVGDIQKSVRSLADDKTFVFRGDDALRWGAVGGAALGLLGTLFNTVAAMLYNLLSDVVGGLQVIVVTEPD